jgi:putative transposase
MPPNLATYPGVCFPMEITGHAAWLHHASGPSLRDVELMQAERGVTVRHESIRRWGLRFGADFT